MTFAARGEDDWILEQFPAGFSGCAVDVGAFDGLSTSNTLLLERSGWRVLCVEPNPGLESRLRAARQLVWMGACGDHVGREAFSINVGNQGSFSSLKPTLDHPDAGPHDQNWTTVEVEVHTLDRLLERFGFDHLDALSVDVEGTELDVLAGFDFKRWKPRVIVVESWDPELLPGWLEPHGYYRADRRLVNDLFLLKDP